MAKMFGLSSNRVHCLGRVVGNPSFPDGWATFNLKTIVPEMSPDKSWNEVECMVPCMTSNQKTIETIRNYVADERQLLIDGYIKAWDGGCGVMVNSIKLGSKTMYDPEAGSSGAGGGSAGGGPTFPPA